MMSIVTIFLLNQRFFIGLLDFLPCDAEMHQFCWLDFFKNDVDNYIYCLILLK